MYTEEYTGVTAVVYTSCKQDESVNHPHGYSDKTLITSIFWLLVFTLAFVGNGENELSSD